MRTGWPLFRIMIFAALPLVAIGMLLVYFESGGPWRKVGMIAFVVGSCLYVGGRIGGILGNRRP